MKKLGNIQLNKKIDQICVSKSNDNPIVFILYDGSIDVYQIKTLDKISSLKNSFPQTNISLISTNSTYPNIMAIAVNIPKNAALFFICTVPVFRCRTPGQAMVILY